MLDPGSSLFESKLHREGARRVGYALTGLFLMLYAVAYLRLYPIVGAQSTALFLVPIGVAAASFGMRGAVVVAVLGIPFHLWINQFVGAADFDALSTGVQIALAGVLGWMRELHSKAKRQQHELEQERTELVAQGSRASRTEADAQRRARQVEVIARVGHLALKSAPADVIREATRGAAEGLGTDFADLLEYEHGQDRFVFRGIHGASEDLLGRTLSAGRGSHSGYTLIVGQPVTVEDYATDPRFHIPIASKQYRLASGLSVIVGDPMGRAFGTLSVYTKARRSFGEEDVRYLQALANLVSVAIARHNAEAARHSATELLAAGLPLDADVDTVVERAIGLVQRSSSAEGVVAELAASRRAALAPGELAHLVVELVRAAEGAVVTVRTSDDEDGVRLEVVGGADVVVPPAARLAEARGARVELATDAGRATLRVHLPAR